MFKLYDAQSRVTIFRHVLSSDSIDETRMLQWNDNFAHRIMAFSCDLALNFRSDTDILGCELFCGDRIGQVRVSPFS
jgi:hypothetical protein